MRLGIQEIVQRFVLSSVLAAIAGLAYHAATATAASPHDIVLPAPSAAMPAPQRPGQPALEKPDDEVIVHPQVWQAAEVSTAGGRTIVWVVETGGACLYLTQHSSDTIHPVVVPKLELLPGRGC